MNTEQMENGQGAAAQPSAGVSNQSSALDVTKLVEALGPHIEAIVERKTQSVKDKRIAGMQGEIDGFKSQLQQLKALQAEGWTEAQAIRLMETQSRPTPGMPAEAQPKMVGNQQSAANIDTTVLAALGFQANDPDVTNILRESPNQIEQINKLATLAMTRKNANATQPSFAQMQPAGNAPGRTETAEVVTQELDRLVGKPGKTNADWNKMAELQAKLRSME